MEKELFIFHKDWYDALKDFSDNVRLEVYDAIMCEAFGESRKDLSNEASIAMRFIRPLIQREQDCETTSKTAVKGTKAVQQSLFEESDIEPSEKMKIATFNYSNFRDFFNNTIKENGSRIPIVRRIDDRRKSMLHARMMDYGIDALYEVVDKVIASKFLNGDNKTGWKADFDWMFGPNNFRKVIEGKYDNREETVIVAEEQTSTINWQS